MPQVADSEVKPEVQRSSHRSYEIDPEGALVSGDQSKWPHIGKCLLRIETL